MRLLLVLLLAFLLGCSSKSGTVAGGPGGQTTNGIIGVVYATGNIPAQGARVTIRPKNFIKSSTEIVRSGELSNGAETVTDSLGRFEVTGLLEGAYLVEILIGDTLGRVDTFTISSDSEIIERDSMSTQPVGVITGVIDPYYLDNYDSVAVRIKGLDRDITIELDGSYRVEALAPWKYDIVIQGFITGQVVVDNVSHEVSSGDTTQVADTLTPINPIHYGVIRRFLDSCELNEVDVHNVVKLSQNDIVEVILTNYMIERIPSNVKELTFVRHLHIDSNSISDVPTDISELQSLLTLNLSSNNIATLPIELGDCFGLTHLDVSANNLTELHATIGYHTGLRVLNISDNSIDKFPTSILALKELTWIDISKNMIADVPVEIVNNYANLLHIDVNYNRIDTTGMESELLQLLNDRSGEGDAWINTQVIQ